MSLRKHNDTDAGAGAILCLASASPTVRSSTFVGNIGQYCIFSPSGSAPFFENCIVAFNVGAAVVCQPGITFSCSDIFGNSGGDWGSCVADQVGVNGNIQADPLFCEPNEGDWSLRSDSPCAPKNSDSCGLIGAFDVGCGVVPTVSVSWGKLKSEFAVSR